MTGRYRDRIRPSLADGIDELAVLLGGGIGAGCFAVAAGVTGSTDLGLLAMGFGPFVTGGVSRSAYDRWRDGAVAGFLAGFLVGLVHIAGLGAELGLGPAFAPFTVVVALAFAVPAGVALGAVAGYLGGEVRRLALASYDRPG